MVNGEDGKLHASEREERFEVIGVALSLHGSIAAGHSLYVVGNTSNVQEYILAPLTGGRLGRCRH